MNNSTSYAEYGDYNYDPHYEYYDYPADIYYNGDSNQSNRFNYSSHPYEQTQTYNNFSKKGYISEPYYNYGTYSHERNYHLLKTIEHDHGYSKAFQHNQEWNMGHIEEVGYNNDPVPLPQSLQISTELGHSNDVSINYPSSNYPPRFAYKNPPEVNNAYSPVSKYGRMTSMNLQQRFEKSPYSQFHYTPLTAHEDQKSLPLKANKSKSQHQLTLNFNKLSTSNGEYTSDEMVLKFKLWCKKKFIVWQLGSEFLKSRFKYIEKIRISQSGKEVLLYTKLTEQPMIENTKKKESNILIAHFPKDRFQKLYNILMELVDVIQKESNMKAIIEKENETTTSIRVKIDFEDDLVNTPSSGSTANDEQF